MLWLVFSRLREGDPAATRQSEGARFLVVLFQWFAAVTFGWRAILLAAAAVLHEERIRGAKSEREMRREGEPWNEIEAPFGCACVSGNGALVAIQCEKATAAGRRPFLLCIAPVHGARPETMKPILRA